jgi:ATP-dependent DNA ligase
MKDLYAEVVKKKGEGLMLRAPGSNYEFGRSDSLRRYKVTNFQLENMTVIGIFRY